MSITKVEIIKTLLTAQDIEEEEKERIIRALLLTEDQNQRSSIFGELLQQDFLTKEQVQKYVTIILFDNVDNDKNDSQAGKVPETETKVSETETIEQKVTRMICELGVPAHLKGYYYIRDAIILGVNDREAIDRITKILYPNIAREYKTTASRVERAIRHAIEVVWTRGNLEILEDYFGYSIDPSKGRPTNSEFIATLIDKIKVG